MPIPIRQQLLEQAISDTVGDRDVEYGNPQDNMANLAGLISAYLSAALETPIAIRATDAAAICVLIKLARTMNGVPKPDTYSDMAAYAAIMGECHEEVDA